MHKKDLVCNLKKTKNSAPPAYKSSKSNKKHLAAFLKQLTFSGIFCSSEHLLDFWIFQYPKQIILQWLNTILQQLNSLLPSFFQIEVFPEHLHE